jgi:hypothetical protein
LADAVAVPRDETRSPDRAAKANRRSTGSDGSGRFEQFVAAGRQYAATVEHQTASAEATSTPSMGRFSVPNLRAAWWAVRTARRTRRKLRAEGLESALAPPPPPELPAAAERGVQAALHRRRHTCLERSIVMQTWLSAHGERRDLIVGVKRPGDEFEAHAWLEGEPAHGDGPFHELLRRPAPSG